MEFRENMIAGQARNLGSKRKKTVQYANPPAEDVINNPTQHTGYESP